MKKLLLLFVSVVTIQNAKSQVIEKYSTDSCEMQSVFFYKTEQPVNRLFICDSSRLWVDLRRDIALTTNDINNTFKFVLQTKEAIYTIYIVEGVVRNIRKYNLKLS